MGREPSEWAAEKIRGYGLNFVLGGPRLGGSFEIMGSGLGVGVGVEVREKQVEVQICLPKAARLALSKRS